MQNDSTNETPTIVPTSNTTSSVNDIITVGAEIDTTRGNLLLTDANPSAPGPWNVVIGQGADPVLGGADQPVAGGDANVIIGYQAAKNNVSGRECTIIGNQAALNIVGEGLGTGPEDTLLTAIGSLAAAGLTSTQDSIFIGQKCGQSIVSSFGDCWIGVHSAINVSSSDQSVVVGRGSMSEAAGTLIYTNHRNTMVGFAIANGAPGSTSKTVATPTSNVFVGAEAAKRIENGSNNVAIGDLAGSNLRDGNQNIFIGQDAGGGPVANYGAPNGVLDGSSNIGIGVNSLPSLMTGSRNIALNTNDLQITVAAGNDNIIVGGWDSQGDPSNIIAIGKRAANGSSAQGGVYIGNNAGSKSRDPHNTCVGDFSGSRLGLGSTPAADNSYFGYNAGEIAFGSNNVAVGSGALSTSDTSHDCVAIGYQANVDYGVSGAIQIGQGLNRNSSTAQLGNQRLMDLDNGQTYSLGAPIPYSELHILTTTANSTDIFDPAQRKQNWSCQFLPLNDIARDMLASGPQSVYAYGTNGLGGPVVINHPPTAGAQFFVLLVQSD